MIFPVSPELNSSLSGTLPFEICDVKINPAKSVPNLGIIVDKIFTLHSHLSAVCRSCFYHILDLWRLRCYLDLDSEKNYLQVLQCLVVSINPILFCLV